MPSSSSSSSISPNKLRSDLYSFKDDDEPKTAMPLVISVLASLMDRAIAKTQRESVVIASCDGSSDARLKDAFDSHRVLDMTVQSFLERISRYARVAPPVFVVAYVYIDRLSQLNSRLRISPLNVHRLLITAIMVASKFVEDRNYRNSYYAKVGGLPTAKLNRLEVDFLFLIRFKLHVSVSVFESYCKHLEREVSFGGGYQIERSLPPRFMLCAGREIAPKEIEIRNNASESSAHQMLGSC